MRRNARVDANQKEIVDALREVGASVQHLHMVGRGCPDILVGWAGNNFLLEIKQDKGKLTEDEKNWHAEWNGQVAVVRNFTEALAALSRYS